MKISSILLCALPAYFFLTNVFVDNPMFNQTINEYFFSLVPLLIEEVFLTLLAAQK